MSARSDVVREALGRTDRNGVHQYDWRLTGSNLDSLVKLVLPPGGVLPVIFVPGIMGSNLKSRTGDDKVWRLDSGVGNIPTKVAKRWLGRSAGARQAALHPGRVLVDSDGDTPDERAGSVFDIADYKRRGWGEVAETSYHAFLIWLEKSLNGEGFNPYYWKDFTFTQFRAAGPRPAPGQPGHVPEKLPPGIAMSMRESPGGAEKGKYLDPVMSDDLLKRAKFRMPVYACGYNWLASNEDAAARLRARILQVIQENNRNGLKCQQVIVVTHSMGGLVARRCAMLAGMGEAIAGIVHGVMPTVGAAVAYRRCKIGMWDEDWKAGMAIGNDGRQTTAVFAQAPGALQLLPTSEYRKGWLKVLDASGRSLEVQPSGDPYTDIYLRRDRWWGLVREEWLKPRNGVPISWNEFAKNIDAAKTFHNTIRAQYHGCTYVYYGDDRKQKSFETVAWKLKPGLRPDNKVPGADHVRQMGYGSVRDYGSNPVYVGGRLESTAGAGTWGGAQTYESSYWELHCDLQDGAGDGTVPASSGRHPMHNGGARIRQQFKLGGFGHEPSFSDPVAQRATLYSIVKIASLAKAYA